MNKQNILVLGQDKFNAAKLKEVKVSQDYEYHDVLDYHYIHSFTKNPMSEIMDEARNVMRNFPGKIDGMICLWDFPGCLMYPILCREFGLTGPSPESVLKCENKYLSRLEQSEVIPECTPEFDGFDPNDPDIIEKTQLDYPFWIKPVSAFSGHLGFEINSDKDFKKALAKIKRRKNLFSQPYNYLEEQMDLPEDVDRQGKKTFIAEKIIGGRQCTVEGFVFQGEVGFHGIIDSLRYPRRMSFSRYQYPSRLPMPIRKRLYEKSEKIMRHAGYDNGSFNIEFFWDKKHDRIWLLEVNTRISQSHCDLFKMVDGELSHKIILDIATDRCPSLPHRQGRYKVAAKLFLRSFKNGTVTKVPTPEKIKALEKQFDTKLHFNLKEGMKLDELKWQDSYSYVIAMAYMGAENQKELLGKFDECANSLDIEVDGKKVRSKQGRKF